MKFSLEEIIKATDAKILKSEVDTDSRFSFSTDTRTIEIGQIYLPLKGENFDGENFIENAIGQGAIGYFCTNEKILDDAKIVLQVENTLIAYLELARFYKRKINPKTVAITGSCGKTTTKEMAYWVAKEQFKTHKSELNFNNEIGLCKTILSMPEDTQVLILEMGMRGLGEIETLSKYSEPDVSIITNVGTAHIGRLGSKKNIAMAKFEITKFQKQDAVLIAHNDSLIKNEVFNAKLSHTVFFDLESVNVIERKIGSSIFEYKNHNYKLNIEGDYNIQNSLAVIEMGLALGIKEDKIAKGLNKYLPIEKRWDVLDIKGYKIINDSYNANPDSMKAVIKTVMDNYQPPILFVLGDMGELGTDELHYHREIGKFLLDNVKENVNIATVGKLAEEIAKELNKKGVFALSFEDNVQISRYILDNVPFGTTIVLKASRSMRFEQIIETIENFNKEQNL